MGRTTPSFRIASEIEIRKWRTFRRALEQKDRKVFDEMLFIPRFYSVAGTMCSRAVLIQVILMSINFEHFKQLSRLATEKIKTQTYISLGQFNIELHHALIPSIITSVSLIILFSSPFGIKSGNSYNSGWLVYAQTNSTSATTLSPVQLEPVESQDDNQSNTTSVNEENSTKYIQYEDTAKRFKIDHPQDWKAVSSDLRNNAVIAFNPSDKIVEVDVKLLPRTNNMNTTSAVRRTTSSMTTNHI